MVFSLSIFTAPLRNFFENEYYIIYDLCHVKVDGNIVIQESGDMGWKRKAVDVSKGPVTIEWEYVKDINTSELADTMKLRSLQFMPRVPFIVTDITVVDK